MASTSKWNFSCAFFQANQPAQFEISDPPSDAISSVRFSPKSTKLLVSSWDSKVYLYALSGASATLEQTFSHRAPVLDVCWQDDETAFFSAGLDWDVRRYAASGPSSFP